MLRTNHVMVDLETMSSKSNAAILAIGAVFLERTDIGSYLIKEEFYKMVNLESSAKYGDISPSTIKWWLLQTKEAQSVIILPARHHTLENGLADFARWYYSMRQKLASQVLPLWGNGAAFDNVVLHNAYQSLDIKEPWSYREDYCYRTLKELYPNIKATEHNNIIKHNALQDAIYQGYHLCKLLNHHEARGGTL